MMEELRQRLEELAKVYPTLLSRRCYSMLDVDSQALSHIPRRAFGSKLLQLWAKYTLTGSDAGALAEVIRTVFDAAYPKQVWRAMGTWFETREAKIKVPVVPKVRALFDAKGGTTPDVSTPPRYVEIDNDLDADGRRIRARVLWDVSFLNASNWQVVEAYTRSVGEAIMVKATEHVYQLYSSLGSSEIAAEITYTPPLKTDHLIDLRSAIDGEDLTSSSGPYRAFLHPATYNQLLKDDKFVNSLAFGETLDKTTGLQSRTTIGIDFHTTSVVPRGEVLLINPERSLVGAIYQNLIVEVVEPSTTLSGIDAYIHIAAKVLEPKAVARLRAA
jgi:hypothetical protein